MVRAPRARGLLLSVTLVVLVALMITPVLMAPRASAAAHTYVKTLAGPSIAAMYSSGLEYDFATNRIVLADTGLDRIDFYSFTGAKLGQFGRHGSGKGQFDSPRDVTVDAASNIYVADAGNDRVQKFSKSGAFLWAVGGQGTSATSLNTPIGLTFDRRNNVLLVASTGQDLIKAFRPNGTLAWTSPPGSVTGIDAPRDVTRGPDNRIWVANYHHQVVDAFDVTAAGAWATRPAIELGQRDVKEGTGANQLNFPYNVAFSPDGHTVYVADTGNDRIARWHLSGTTATWLSPFGGHCAADPNPCPNPPADKGFFDDLRRVAIGPSGTIIGDDFWGNGLQVFSPSGTVIREIAGRAAPAPGFAQAYGVAVGPDGTTYGVDRLNQRIERFAPGGAFLNAAGGRGVQPGKMSWPEAVAVAPDRTVWVADTRNDRIQHWPANLSGASSVPSFGSTGKAIGQFNYPEDLTVDSHGKVWVADTKNDRIQTFVPATKTFHNFGRAGAGPGQLQDPEGVAVSAAAVFVADTGNNRIEKFTLAGAFVAQYSTGLLAPEGVATAPDGSVWVADTGHSRLVHLSAALKNLGDGFGSRGTGTMQFNLPHTLDIHGGLIYVADTYNNRVQVFR